MSCSSDLPADAVATGASSAEEYSCAAATTCRSISARDEATIHEGYRRAAPRAPERPSRDRNGRAGRHARAVMAAQEAWAKGPSQGPFARAPGGPLSSCNTQLNSTQLKSNQGSPCFTTVGDGQVKLSQIKSTRQAPLGVLLAAMAQLAVPVPSPGVQGGHFPVGPAALVARRDVLLRVRRLNVSRGAHFCPGHPCFAPWGRCGHPRFAPRSGARA